MENARAKVLEEEERVANIEKEFTEVLMQVDAHKADEKKERRRREEAREAEAARVEEVNSDMDVTEDVGGDESERGWLKYEEDDRARPGKVHEKGWMGCAASECSEFVDQGDSNSRFVPPTQEDAAFKPCG